MKNFFVSLVAVCLLSPMAFAGEPTASDFARALKIQSLQRALAQVPGSASHLAMDFEQLGGMESTGLRVTINLTGRSDRSGQPLQDCEMAVERILPKYGESGELNDVDSRFTDVELKTMPVVMNTCTQGSR